MPTFRFTATDRNGLFRSGSLDADTEDEARASLRDRGYAVRELHEEDDPALSLTGTDRSPPAPRRPPTRRIEPIPRPAPAPLDRPPAGGGNAPLILASLGCLVALLAAGYVVYRDPPWKAKEKEAAPAAGLSGNLGKYDFSSPEAAQRSMLRMQLDADVGSIIEYETKFDRKKRKERLETLEVKRTVDYPGANDRDRGKKVIFYTYKEGGKEKRATQWYERDEDSGLWRRTYLTLPRFSPNGKTDEREAALADEIRQWSPDPAFDD